MKFGHKKRYWGCPHTGGRPCVDTARRQPFANERQRPKEKPNLMTLASSIGLELPVSSNVRK